jgi:hypothetical protein
VVPVSVLTFFLCCWVYVYGCTVEIWNKWRGGLEFIRINKPCGQKIDSFVCLGTGEVSDFFPNNFSISYICLLPAEFSAWGGGQSTRQKTTGTLFGTVSIRLL